MKNLFNCNIFTASAQDIKQEDATKFVVTTIVFTILIAVFQVIVVGISNFVRPGLIPYHFFDMWKTTGTVSDWLAAAWPIFAWAIGINAYFAITTWNDPKLNKNAEGVMVLGTILSLWAGITEEILFRWLIFLAAIPLSALANFLFFGFATGGHGLLEWFTLTCTAPLANFVTGGMLQHYLANPSNWLIAAAIISANASFRDGHKYQGMLGWVNSWFIGMWFFYLALTFGLPASMLCHFVYDIFCFGVKYIDCAIERALGRTEKEAQ